MDNTASLNLNNQTPSDTLFQKLNNIQIYGIGMPLYLVIFAAIFAAMLLGWLPAGMLGAFMIMMVFGGLFNYAGNHLPIIKTYLGGGAIVCIFASAILVYTGVIPQTVIDNVDSFMNTTGFLNFYIAALITGCILGMSRTLLLKAAIRFLPVALCAMTMAILAVGVVGMLLGYGFVDAIMYVAIPMMGGGMGAGVVPLSGMYAQALGVDASGIISRMIPASTLGNVTAIIMAGMLHKLGEIKPSLSGNGKLMKKDTDDMSEDQKPAESIQLMGMGLITAGLCTTNMGGTGDIAVLSSAKRIELLPFAQIATRICDAHLAESLFQTRSSIKSTDSLK